MPIPQIQTAVPVPLLRSDNRVIDSLFHCFSDLPSAVDHFAVRLGPTTGAEPPLVRIHSECATGDLFGSARCDCGPQLQEAIERIAREGGCILYLRQEGRGIGLAAKLEAYKLQDQGLDTFAANRALGFPDDLRDFSEAALMLRALGMTRIRLLSNNPEKERQLQANGIVVTARLATETHLSDHNKHYLRTKADHGAHTITLPEAS